MTTTTIADQVKALEASKAGQPANAALSAFATEQAELASTGGPSGVLVTGSSLSDVPLLDSHGEATSLYAALGDGPAVLVLYRGAWCPYCNIALRTYESELMPALTERGIPLVAISPQKPDGSLSMQEKNQLTFIVVSDPANAVARQLGVLTAPSDEVRKAQLQLGLDLTAVNADETTGIPMPTAAIVDPDHTLRWIDVHRDYSVRSEPADILAALGAAGSVSEVNS